MLHLIHERAAREQIADRIREADRLRFARQGPSRAEQTHRQQVERVRASLLLVPSTPSDDTRES